MEEKDTAVKALLCLTLMLTLYLLVWQISEHFFSIPVYYYARLIELSGVVLFAVLALTTPMRFQDMGIVVPARTLVRSLALGAGIAAVGLGALVLLAARRGTLSFSWHMAGDISRYTYILVAPFQEILAKSVMLYSFELVFRNRHPHLATVMSALSFAAFHVVYGVRMMVLALALCCITGWIFHRERCVWGCSLAHFAFGFFPVFSDFDLAFRARMLYNCG